MDKATIKSELILIMQMLAQHGYKCFTTTKGEYGFIITPSDNVLYIQRDTYWWQGWTFSLAYIPSTKNGSGCGCLEDPVQEVDVATVERAESEGLSFALRLGAELYRDSDSWMRKYWAKDDLVRIE